MLFPSGYVVFVQSDIKGKWWLALDWQKKRFMDAMQFGTMKSMGYPVEFEETDMFAEQGHRYKIEIYDETKAVLVNLDTDKRREFRYSNLD